MASQLVKAEVSTFYCSCSDRSEARAPGSPIFNRWLKRATEIKLACDVSRQTSGPMKGYS